MKNILFKVIFPAEFHAQTAVEAAIQLHFIHGKHCEDIKRIVIETQQAGMRIINKTGALKNPADRDHCLQYMVAIALLYGNLSSEDYHDDRASDARIDRLRDCMEVIENREFTRAYHNPSQRAIPSAVQLFFNDESQSQRIVLEYPLGHRNRREVALPLLQKKFRDNTKNYLDEEQCDEILGLIKDNARFDALSVGDFLQLFHAQS